MIEKRNAFVGVLMVILGLMVIIFPLMIIFTFSVLTGIGIIFLAIWLFLQSFRIWDKNLAAGIADMALAFLALAFGIIFIGNIKGFEFMIFMAMYIASFFLILTGLVELFSAESFNGKVTGASGVIFGLLFLLLGTYVGNLLVLAAIIGAFLIILGIMEFFEKLDDVNIPNQEIKN